MSRLVSQAKLQYQCGRWEYMDDQNTVVKLVELNEYCSEYERVESKMEPLTPTRMERVQNPYLLGLYQLKKEECMNRNPSVIEMEFWHATGAINVQSIVSGNFDWRLSVRCKFGKGVSFSPDANYANRYCSSDCGRQRALILTKVLVGGMNSGGYGTQLPTTTNDTTTGNAEKVYVKYSDYEFYPSYVAYYNAW